MWICFPHVTRRSQVLIMNWFHSPPCHSSGSALPWFSWTFPHGHRMSHCSCSKQEGNRKRHSSKTSYPWSGRKIILRHPPPSSVAFPLGHRVGLMAVPGHKRGWEMNICHFQLQQWEKGSATRKKVNQCLPPYSTFVFLFIINQIYFFQRLNSDA